MSVSERTICAADHGRIHHLQLIFNRFVCMFINENGVNYTVENGYLILFADEERRLVIPAMYGGALIDPDSWNLEKLEKNVIDTRGVSFDYGEDAFGQTLLVSFQHEGRLIQFSVSPPVELGFLTPEEYFEFYSEELSPEYIDLKEGIERSAVPSVREADLFKLIEFSVDKEVNLEIARQLIKQALERKNKNRFALN